MFGKNDQPPHRSHLLIREGFCSGTEAVAWADSWLLRLDNPPDELTQISLSRGNLNEILSALGRLAFPTLSEQAFGQLCGLLLARQEAVNSLLWRVYYDRVDGIRPLEFEPGVDFYWFQEWENLIPDGYITMDELRQEVIEFLRLSNEIANQHHQP